jgi:L-alanine-DL-glutamate epimerase-like enolase superfamily enzyme
MKITRFEASHFRVPREIWWGSLPVSGSLYSISSIELITCEIETDEGQTGFGLTYTVGHGGSAIHATLRDEIGPELLRRDCRAPETIWHELWFRLHWVGRGGVVATAIAAADIALWDARAKSRALPLYEFLGAHRDSIAAYGSGVNLGYSLDQLVSEAQGFHNLGFDAVKIKVGRSSEEDIERVRAVRAAVGNRCRLMLDANMGWTLAEAGLRLKRLEPYDIDWLEEPLAPEDIAGHAALQASTTVPLAAGESLFSPWEFASYFRAGAVRIAQPDVTRLGVTGWLKVAHAAELFHIPIAPHFVPEIHVHLTCAIPNALRLEYLPWLERLLSSKLEIVDGIARPPSSPGHGVMLDRELLEPYRVRGATV